MHPFELLRYGNQKKDQTLTSDEQTALLNVLLKERREGKMR